MQKKIVAAICVATMLITVVLSVFVFRGGEASHEMTIMQSNGEPITLTKEADRIVTTSLNVAEVLCVIGAADKLVGVANSTLINPEMKPLLKDKTDIGSRATPSIDTILKLNADLIIVYTGETTQNLVQLESTGIPVVQICCSGYPKIIDEIRSLGKITGCTEKANRLANLLDKVEKRISNANSALDVTAYFESFSENSAEGMNGAPGQLLEAAGATNIVREESGSIKIQPSFVIAQNPDYIFKRILLAKWDTAASAVQQIYDRPGYDELDAIKNGRVYAILSNVAGGPRSFVGLIIIGEILNPGCSGDLTVESTMAEYNALSGTNFLGTGSQVCYSGT